MESSLAVATPEPLTTEKQVEEELGVIHTEAHTREAGRAAFWFRFLCVLFFLYVFIVSVKAMGSGLKLYADDPVNNARIHQLFSYANNPFVGLAAGILITALVQSSSFTTSLVISLVAAEQLTVTQAVTAIMGANIGTSITNTIVSLAHWRNRHEFQTAFSAAIVHDVFNFLTVLLLLPLELMTGVLSYAAKWSASVFHLPEKMALSSGFIGTITKPAVGSLFYLFTDVMHLSKTTAGIMVAIISVLLLFLALVMLVRLLKSLMLGRMEALFRRFFFSNTLTALVVGILMTVLVQSSSVTTSLIIPFVGAGLLTLRQVFPYMVGANIGTTCTGLLAAAAAHTSGGLMIAFVHLIFNVTGACIFIPLRKLPINIARRCSHMAYRNRMCAIFYIMGVFWILPVLCVFLFSLFT